MSDCQDCGYMFKCPKCGSPANPNLGVQFVHDCDGCVYLGSMLHSEPDGNDRQAKYGGYLEAYYCPGVHCPSFLLRFGNEPDEYGSNNVHMAVRLSEEQRYTDAEYDRVFDMLARYHGYEPLNAYTGKE